jgi:hypothetical protein
MKIKELKKFNSISLPITPNEQEKVLSAKEIKKIICFCIGPEGTNIQSACKLWIKKTGVEKKTEIVLCKTPEESIKKAREVKEKECLAIFWTCAVYNKLHEIFFKNPDTLTFFIQMEMFLDNMQLAALPEHIKKIKGGKIPKTWKIASHPSPAPLLSETCCKVYIITSNAQAAKLCASGKVDACITTESAKKIHGLKTIHEFGSPKMIFFGGITINGVELILKVLHKKNKKNSVL